VEEKKSLVSRKIKRKQPTLFQEIASYGLWKWLCESPSLLCQGRGRTIDFQMLFTHRSPGAGILTLSLLKRKDKH
jgi:hypothetical protein